MNCDSGIISSATHMKLIRINTSETGGWLRCTLIILTLLLISAKKVDQQYFDRVSVMQRVCISNRLGISKKCAQYVVRSFNSAEKEREMSEMKITGSSALVMSNASSSPFISGNGFRMMCYPYIVETAFPDPNINRTGWAVMPVQKCYIDADLMSTLPDGKSCSNIPLRVVFNFLTGHCVFVATDCLHVFLAAGIRHIPGRLSIVVHNGDQSSPDGQTDNPGKRGTYNPRLVPSWQVLFIISSFYWQG